MPYSDPEQRRAANQRWKAENHERRVAVNRIWEANNPERMREYQRTKSRNWKARHPDASRWTHLKYRYKITPGRWETMYLWQGGRCAGPGCCAEPVQVDHDHACCSGARRAPTCGHCVRGLLCARCNKRDVLAGTEHFGW